MALTITVTATNADAPQPSDTKKYTFGQDWGEVAAHFGCSTKTLERDRDALNRFNDPISDDLLKWLGWMRSWCSLGRGGRSQFNRITFAALKQQGLIESKLREYGILAPTDEFPD